MKIRFIGIGEISRLSLREIFNNKFRSFLTILGITIGVLAIIMISSIIHGLNSSVIDRVASLGANSFFATKHEPGVHIGRPKRSIRQRKNITYKDVEFLRKKCKYVDVISPFLTARSLFGGKYIVKYRGERAENPLIRGVEETFDEAMGTVVVEYGRFFNKTDLLHRRYVTVLGAGIAESLFPYMDPIGKRIRINGREFEVIGVLEHQKGIFGGFSEDNYVLIPLSTFMKIWPEVKDMAIAFKVNDPKRMVDAMEEVRYYLRVSRKVMPGKPDDFSVFSANLLVNIWKSLTKILFIVTIVVASIGLLVGGIGVMNIMFVSVRERTREIGLRKACGATKRDVLLQFIIEATILSMIGGVIGIILGIIGTGILNFAVPQLPARVSMFWLLLGFFVSAGVGLLFGILPAYKAAQLNPIECLRYE